MTVFNLTYIHINNLVKKLSGSVGIMAKVKPFLDNYYDILIPCCFSPTSVAWNPYLRINVQNLSKKVEYFAKQSSENYRWR